MIAAARTRFRLHAAQNPAYRPVRLFFNDLRTFCTASSHHFPSNAKGAGRDFQIHKKSFMRVFRPTPEQAEIRVAVANEIEQFLADGSGNGFRRWIREV